MKVGLRIVRSRPRGRPHRRGLKAESFPVGLGHLKVLLRELLRPRRFTGSRSELRPSLAMSADTHRLPVPHGGGGFRRDLNPPPTCRRSLRPHPHQGRWGRKPSASSGTSAVLT